MSTYTRKLLVKHRTEFTYEGGAAESVNEIRLGPVDGPRQWVEYAHLTVTPTADLAEFRDAWGNRVSWCQIVERHERLTIVAESLVHVAGQTFGDRDTRGSWQRRDT